MTTQVKVPKLSESVSEATLVFWNKKEGDFVKRDENLVDIETDKVVLEMPAPVSGVLVRILEKDGASVISGQVIAEIDSDAKETVSSENNAQSKPTSSVSTEEIVQGLAASASVAAKKPGPAARKALAEKGITADQVQGTGPENRVTVKDINALSQPQKEIVSSVTAPLSQPATALPDLSDRPEQRVPMSRLRARIAERLLHSQSTNAILTTFNEVNMAPVMDLRKRYQPKFEKEHGVKLGFMSFFVKAAVQALKRYPIINSSVDGNDIVYHGYFDIGIAVGSPRGLVVPILRDCDQMSMAQIERKIAEYGQKAKEGKLSIEDLTGGTFSISNGGIFGSMLSTPIINPPQSAILGVHATRERPVVEDGEILIRPMNYLALSYDHRIIDGREAVLGLVAMKEALEDPVRLILNI